jgi:hypothetical protein
VIARCPSTNSPGFWQADDADRMWDHVQTQGDPTHCWYHRVDNGTHNLWDTLDLTRLQQFLASFDLVPPTATPSV